MTLLVSFVYDLLVFSVNDPLSPPLPPLPPPLPPRLPPPLPPLTFRHLPYCMTHVSPSSTGVDRHGSQGTIRIGLQQNPRRERQSGLQQLWGPKSGN